MLTCPGCGHPVTEHGLWLAQPTLTGTALDYCGPVCGARADGGLQAQAVQALLSDGPIVGYFED